MSKNICFLNTKCSSQKIPLFSMKILGVIKSMLSVVILNDTENAMADLVPS